MPTSSPNIETIEGETPGGLPTGSVLNLYDSCNLAAQGITDAKFRFVEVNVVAGGSGATKAGYRTADPKKVLGTLTLPQIEHKWYDLKNVVVKLGGAGDKVTFFAVR